MHVDLPTVIEPIFLVSDCFSKDTKAGEKQDKRKAYASAYQNWYPKEFWIIEVGIDTLTLIRPWE
jgi:hypothetical protein